MKWKRMANSGIYTITVCIVALSPCDMGLAPFFTADLTLLPVGLKLAAFREL